MQQVRFKIPQKILERYLMASFKGTKSVIFFLLQPKVKTSHKQATIQ